MSDVCDRAEGCAAAAARGALFVSRRPRPTAGRGPLPPCACGTCGNAVGPMSARHALAEAWRLGGRKGGTE